MIEPAGQVNLFGTDQPHEVIARAHAHARELDRVIRDRQLFKRIGDKDHILVEGWTLLGSMLGVFPVVIWTHEIENGFEARVEARTLAGAIVGAAESQCTRDENLWKSRDAYALRSMAQTRATSKALRGPLGFIVQLAGFNPTPAEEIPPEPPTTAEPPAKKNGKAISEAQTKRLWTVFRGTGMPEEVLRDLVKNIAGVESTKDIPKDKYDAVIAAIEEADRTPF